MVPVEPSTSRAERAAAVLAHHRRERLPFAGFDDDLRPRGSDDAYAIQAALHSLLSADGDGQAGWKIGCTTPTMQEYLGIHEPAGGHIRAASVAASGARVVRADLVRPGVECELAVRLVGDLGAPCDRASARAAIGSVMAAIEIVDERYDDWRALDAATLTADDFFGAGAILGGEDVPWRDLDLGAVTATMRLNGEDIGSGHGADILGDPIAALLWLVNGPARETGLASGSIVLLGSLVQTHWVEQGDVVAIENEPFGSVSVEFV